AEGSAEGRRQEWPEGQERRAGRLDGWLDRPELDRPEEDDEHKDEHEEESTALTAGPLEGPGGLPGASGSDATGHSDSWIPALEISRPTGGSESLRSAGMSAGMSGEMAEHMAEGSAAVPGSDPTGEAASKKRRRRRGG